MKIGILTFHHTYNFGASLQAFALQTYLKSLGNDVYIINYLNDKMYNEQLFSLIDKKKSKKYNLIKIFNAPSQLKRRKKFDKFDKKFLNITPNRIRTSEELSELLKDFDRIIVGSDQVMNLVGTGFDYNYYLDFDIPSYKKATYAPSFGLQNLDDETTEKMKKLLLDIKYLNAREENGVELVKNLIDKDVPLVCDPTFLLNKCQWNEYAVKPKIKKPYVLIYSFNAHKAIEEAAIKKAKEIGGIVIDIHRFVPKVKKGFKIKRNISPFEMIGLIMNASYVFTNSFHGAALSLNFNKNVMIFKHPINENAGSFNPNFRLVTLSKKLNVDKYLVTINDNVKSDDIDYKLVNERLDSWREFSFKVIDNILEN